MALAHDRRRHPYRAAARAFSLITIPAAAKFLPGSGLLRHRLLLLALASTGFAKSLPTSGRSLLIPSGIGRPGVIQPALVSTPEAAIITGSRIHRRRPLAARLAESLVSVREATAVISWGCIYRRRSLAARLAKPSPSTATTLILRHLRVGPIGSRPESGGLSPAPVLDLGRPAVAFEGALLLSERNPLHLSRLLMTEESPVFRSAPGDVSRVTVGESQVRIAWSHRHLAADQTGFPGLIAGNAPDITEPAIAEISGADTGEAIRHAAISVYVSYIYVRNINVPVVAIAAIIAASPPAV